MFAFASIRVRIFCAIAVIGAVSAVALIYAAWQERERDIDREVAKLDLLMDRLTGESGQLIGDSVLLVRVIAKLDAVRSGDAGACDTAIRRLAELDDRYHGFGVADASGEIWCSARERTRPVSVAGFDWFENAKQLGGPAIGSPRTHQIVGQPTLPIGQPVLDERGQVIGVVVAAIDISALNERLATIRSSPSMIVTLYNDDREIIARAPDPEKFFRKVIPGSAAGPAPRVHAAFETTALDGVRRIFYQAPIVPSDPAPLTVAIGVDKSSVVAAAQQGLIRNLAILLLTLGAAAMLVWQYLGRHVIDPLGRATEIARLVSAGQPRSALGPPYPSGEPGELMAAFDQMDAAIADRGADLQRAHARLIDAIESLSDGFLLFNSDNALEISNRRAREILTGVEDLLEPGVAYATIVRALLDRGLALEPADRDRSWIHGRIRGDSTPTQTFEIRFADGRRCRVSDRFTSDGGTVSIIADITRQSEQQEALARSEQRFRALAEHAPVGVFEADARGLWIYANQRALRMTQLVGLDGLEDRWLAALVPDDRARVADQWIEAVQGSRLFQCEFRIDAGDGKRLDVLGVAAPILAVGDAGAGYVGTMVDLTELKLAEAALAQAQKLQALGQLTGGVAHDFNNLLTVILGGTDQIRAAVGNDEKVRLLVDMSHAAAQRAADLVSQLLVFARSAPSREIELDVSQVISALRPLLQHRAMACCSLELSLAENLPAVHLDRAQLEAAILNLALNALAAMPEGGRLLLETSLHTVTAPTPAIGAMMPPGTYVALSATDDGHGMSAEILSRVFEPFFTTKPPGEGTGLGLSIIYGFVSRARGYIQVASTVGQGSRFTLLFRPADGADGRPLAARKEDGPVQGGGETILVVEDEAYLRSFVSQQLAGLGYRVLLSANASEAIALLESNAGIDLLFADVRMPGPLKGDDLARMARERWPRVKVLMTSGFAGSLAELESMTLLPKPYTWRELAVALRGALDGA